MATWLKRFKRFKKTVNNKNHKKSNGAKMVKKRNSEKEKTKEKRNEKSEKVEKASSKVSGNYLVDLELYIKTRIYVGHKIITPDMRPYIFRRKADGVAIFNTDLVDQKLRELISYLSKFEPHEIIVVGKKQQCVNALRKFSAFTGIKAFIKYPPGILTNPSLENFIDPKVVFIVDPIADKNALHDANKVKIPVIAFCNSNHYTRGIDFVVPINNMEEPSLSLAFYLIAKGYLEARGIKPNFQLDDFLDLKELEKKS